MPFDRRLVFCINWPMLGLLALLFGIGVLNLYSASGFRMGDELSVQPFYSRQLIWGLGGLFCLMRGQLVTAYALTDVRQDQIKGKLEKQSGKKLVLSFAVDPAILGGVLLKVGDKVLDASLRAQLEILKEQIKRGE